MCSRHRRVKWSNYSLRPLLGSVVVNINEWKPPKAFSLVAGIIQQSDLDTIQVSGPIEDPDRQAVLFALDVVVRGNGNTSKIPAFVDLEVER